MWEGKAATQSYADEGYGDWVQPGGGLQIFVPQSDSEIPETISKIPTNWGS